MYESRVVIYDRRGFIRLATGNGVKDSSLNWQNRKSVSQDHQKLTIILGNLIRSTLGNPPVCDRLRSPNLIEDHKYKKPGLRRRLKLQVPLYS